MSKKNNRMYKDAKTWNPFRGCRFDCTYCVPSFKRQAKRQGHLCPKCASFEPHFHEDRLQKPLPAEKIIFVGGVGDLSFCADADMRRIIDRVRQHDLKQGNREYYFQSKRPEYFQPYLPLFSKGCVLVTTLETNRDKGYRKISKAPLPTERYQQFVDLDYPRKVITVEPLMDFDLAVFAKMIIAAKPEYVWLGFNSRPKSVSLPEPSRNKALELEAAIQSEGIPVRRKDLRP